jgi:predicted nucleic acid-binding protein
MAQFDEIRRLAFESRSRIAEDRAALRRLAQELSYTDQVIERATLAYNVSLWTLEKFERSHSPQSASSRVSNFAADLRPGSSSK